MQVVDVRIGCRHDRAHEHVAVARDVLGGRVHDEVGTVLERPLQEIGEELLAAKKKAPTKPSQPSALKKTVDAVLD